MLSIHYSTDGMSCATGLVTLLSPLRSVINLHPCFPFLGTRNEGADHTLFDSCITP